jgi:hypothetical protein
VTFDPSTRAAWRSVSLQALWATARSAPQRPPQTGFAQLEGLVEAEACPLSGQRPAAHCPHRRREWFIEGTEPAQDCDVHRLFRIDAATGLLATERTPPEAPEERVAQGGE